MILPELLDSYCKTKAISLPKLAKIIGIRYHTLHRFMNGHEISAENWTKIVIWMLTGTVDLK
jgi:plasmid maintenance system antidote protein VapI